MADVTYPPLDTLKPVAPDVFIVDSGPFGPIVAKVPVRMTVIRLGNGGLWLHSPTRFMQPLLAEMNAEGSVQHLIAPNSVHWSFVKEWQAHAPDAKTWAAPGLRKRPAVQRSDVRIDAELRSEAPDEWAGEIEHVVIPGGAGFREVAFFHRSSRTLVLTDLVVNLEAEKFPAWQAIGIRLLGAAPPNGKAPIYTRAIFRRGGEDAKAAAQRLVALEPERVIFSHGKWFSTDGAAQLRRSLDWLLT